MSVVVDTATPFFGRQTYTYTRATRAHSASPPQEQFSGISTKRATHMSLSGRRASSSSASNHAQSTPMQQHNGSQTASQPSQQLASDFSSPSRAGSAATPTDSKQASDMAGSTGSESVGSTPEARPAKIRVRDLEHIQSFACDDADVFSETRSRSRSRSATGHRTRQYEISEMKVEHIIEMVAGLLTKITTTNDRQHEHLHRQSTQLESASHLDAQTSSVLSFHGKNVPTITILSYLSRINKYCPTSYEVFLSLLVYFDRMTERVNAGPMQSLRQATDAAATGGQSAQDTDSDSTPPEQSKMEGVTSTAPHPTQTVTPPASGSLERGVEQGMPGTPHSRSFDSPPMAPEPGSVDPYDLSHFFVVDSFNIHRLVIAGVTCASKFFSDIFYTNSRYAKVSYHSRQGVKSFADPH